MRTRILRVLVACALFAGSVGVAAKILVGSPSSAEAALAEGDDPLFPPYPGTRVFPMGSAGTFNGVPLKMAYFTAQATPTDVIRFYESVWRAKHLHVSGDATEDAAKISALNGVDGTLRSVTVRREGDRVMAFLSSSPTTQMGVQAASDIPVPDSALFTDRVDVDGTSTVTYIVKETIEAHQKALEATFASKGWHTVPKRTRTTPHGLVMEFERDGRVAMAALLREKKDEKVAVQIHAASAGTLQGGTEER